MSTESSPARSYGKKFLSALFPLVATAVTSLLTPTLSHAAGFELGYEGADGQHHKVFEVQVGQGKGTPPSRGQSRTYESRGQDEAADYERKAPTATSFTQNGIETTIIPPVQTGHKKDAPAWMQIHCVDRNSSVLKGEKETPFDWTIKYDLANEKGSYTGLMLIMGGYYEITANFKIGKQGKIVLSSTRVKATERAFEDQADSFDSILAQQAKLEPRAGDNNLATTLRKNISMSISSSNAWLAAHPPAQIEGAMQTIKTPGKEKYSSGIAGEGQTTQFHVIESGRGSEKIEITTQYFGPHIPQGRQKTSRYICHFSDTPNYMLEKQVTKNIAEAMDQNKGLEIVRLHPQKLERPMRLELLMQLAALDQRTSTDSRPWESGVFSYQDYPLVDAFDAIQNLGYAPPAGLSRDESFKDFISFCSRELDAAYEDLTPAATQPTYNDSKRSPPLNKMVVNAAEPKERQATRPSATKKGGKDDYSQLELLEAAAEGRIPVSFGPPASYQAPKPQ